MLGLRLMAQKGLDAYEETSGLRDYGRAKSSCPPSPHEKPRYRLSDDQVWQQIIKLTGVTNSSDFQKLNKDKQRETLRTLLDIGASVRQLQRLTGLGRGIIQRV